MLVSVGGAWLIVFVLLVLASEPGFRLAAAANAAADNITAAQRPQQQMRLQQLSSSQDAELAPQDSSVREQFVTGKQFFLIYCSCGFSVGVFSISF